MARPPEFAAKRRATREKWPSGCRGVPALTRRRGGDIHPVMTFDTGRDLEDAPVANAVDRP